MPTNSNRWLRYRHRSGACKANHWAVVSFIQNTMGHPNLSAQRSRLAFNDAVR